MKSKKLKKGLWAILNPIKFEITISILLSTFSAISLIVSLTLLSFILSNIIKNTPIIIFNNEINLINTILLLAGVIVISFIARFSSFTVSHLGAFKLEQILRTNLTLHLAKIPLGYISTIGSGSLKKVIQNDVKNLHAFVADSVPMIAKSTVAPLITLIILLWVDFRLALASLFVLFIGTIIMAFTMKDSSFYRKKYEQSQSEINKAVVEFVQAMPVVRTFDNGSQSSKRYIDSLNSYRKNLNAWISKTSFSAKLGILILSPLPTLIIVLIVGIFLLDKGSLELSHLILALFLSTGMADSLMPVMWLTNFIKKSQVSAIKIQEIFEIEELPQAKNSKNPDNFSITFENVFFSYNKTKKKVLKNINFKVPEKSITALIGPSGAGKSTIAKLIPRFWETNNGKIKIGGIDVKDIKTKNLMDIVSFVFQDTFLFNDTILNNIKIANPNATDNDVLNAAKAAQIHDFIISLPDGYQSKANDRGTNLSGGQKQRITIARAILRNNPIVILDEATAFADPENEEKIIAALANLTKNKTVIIIAHRLSTIKDVDQIIVIDEGKILELGKHQDLLKNKKTYYELWNNYQEAQKWNLELKEEKL